MYLSIIIFSYDLIHIIIMYIHWGCGFCTCINIMEFTQKQYTWYFLAFNLMYYIHKQVSLSLWFLCSFTRVMQLVWQPPGVWGVSPGPYPPSWPLWWTGVLRGWTNWRPPQRLCQGIAVPLLPSSEESISVLLAFLMLRARWGLKPIWIKTYLYNFVEWKIHWLEVISFLFFS